MKKYNLDVYDYDMNWPSLYVKEKAALIDAVIGYEAVFEHIGGTSIPGLSAKPIIDIAIGLTDFMMADRLVERIQPLGYHYEPDMVDIYPEFKFLWKGEKLNGSFDIHTYHISIQSFESDSWKNPLLFRNYLRKNPNIARCYGKLKKELSRKHVTDNATYTKDKGTFIQSILSKARQEHRVSILDPDDSSN